MNEVNVIINGTKYDIGYIDCYKECELSICNSCSNMINDYSNFKKSNKSFEK